MTRTDVVASSRPQKAEEAPKRKGSSAMRKLAVLPVAFALMMALVVPSAFAAEEGLSGYNSKPKSTTTPTTGTSPSKESSTPSKTTAPETSSAEPEKSSEPTATTAQKSLPFTGFDLRWTLGAGVVLLVMGFSIVGVQRRQRRSER
jgi:cytoskeletal protein RodZ